MTTLSAVGQLGVWSLEDPLVSGTGLSRPTAARSVGTAGTGWSGMGAHGAIGEGENSDEKATYKGSSSSTRPSSL